MTGSTCTSLLLLLSTLLLTGDAFASARLPTTWTPGPPSTHSEPEKANQHSRPATRNLGTTSHQLTNPYSCTGSRTRREIRTLTRDERTAWSTALNALRTQASEFAHHSEWDVLVALHVAFRDEAHGGAYFLPWHRVFLLRLENAMQKNMPDFTLPYWDWGVDAADAALSRIWRPRFVGGAITGPAPIPNGPFANSSGDFPFPHTVMRNFSAGVSGAIPTLWNSTELESLISDNGTFGDFADAIEAAHDLPHFYIGGDMLVTEMSPNDPIFFLHHAFVDSLWYRRQRRIGRRWEFDGTHDFLSRTVNVTVDDRIVAFNITVRNVLEFDCVSYAPFRRASPTVAVGLPQDLCKLPEFQRDPKLTAERCRNADEVLRRHSSR